ncbi:MAG: hypothetical protein KC486_04700 [Myxococcales bacterium]|nr:hypothetical protein [Myxococcales bacterium]
MLGPFVLRLFFGAGLVLLGFILPMIGSEAEHLGAGGFALLVVGLAGRSATRPFSDERAEARG